MSEAPEKIWKVDGYWEFYSTNEDENEIPYIRDDIVDELLKALIAIGAGQGDPKEVAIQAIDNYMEEE